MDIVFHTDLSRIFFNSFLIILAKKRKKIVMYNTTLLSKYIFLGWETVKLNISTCGNLELTEQFQLMKIELIKIFAL